MRNLIKKALTRRRGKVEIPPSQSLLLGIYFAIASLICLTALETTYIIVVRSFSSEIFAAITLVIGTILGAFFGQKA